MIELCRQNLLELKNLLKSLTSTQYQQKLDVLSGVSIGQHIRHILEFYNCLAKSKESGIVNYDARRRDITLETNLSFACSIIDNIIDLLLEAQNPKPINLICNYNNPKDSPLMIGTTYQRELWYCFEHSIHHQALIKVGLKELNLENLIHPDFGVAPATLKHQNLN
ncbi:MAG: hypothetical protein JJU28_05635 [Cyclobacteriaceae bacterium]|nr:hypothetical protein [Cyclobacteriaceae bacterium]